MNSHTLSESFTTMTQKLPDLERLISRIHAKALAPKQFVLVLKSFRKLQQGLATLQTQLEEQDAAKTAPLVRKIQAMPDVISIIDSIEEMFTLEEDDCIVPNKGADEAWDENEETLATCMQQLEDHLAEYAQQLRLKSSDIQFTDKGTKEIFCIELPANTKVPSSWTSLGKTLKKARYYSPEVKKLVQTFKEAKETKGMLLKQFAGKLYDVFDEHYQVNF